MKKFIAIAGSVCMMFAAQSAMAFTGQINAGEYLSQAEAVEAGQQVAEEILAGTNSKATMFADRHCVSPRSTEFLDPEISVNPTWKNSGNGYEQVFKTKVKYSVLCREINNP